MATVFYIQLNIAELHKFATLMYSQKGDIKSGDISLDLQSSRLRSLSVSGSISCLPFKEYLTDQTSPDLLVRSLKRAPPHH